MPGDSVTIDIRSLAICCCFNASTSYPGLPGFMDCGPQNGARVYADLINIDEDLSSYRCYEQSTMLTLPLYYTPPIWRLYLLDHAV